MEEIAAPDLDTMIRRMGWHFQCVLRPYDRKGFGLTEANATRRALAIALKHLASQYNAAELIGIQSRSRLGLHVAIVTLQPRLIQEHTWLDFLDKKLPLAVHAK